MDCKCLYSLADRPITQRRTILSMLMCTYDKDMYCHVLIKYVSKNVWMKLLLTAKWCACFYGNVGISEKLQIDK